MTRVALVTVICAFVVAPTSADMVSFLSADSFAGVDGDTSGWSTGNDMVNLGVSLSLLGGMASANAYTAGSPDTLTQRGFRGLGVRGWTNDEVDSQNLGLPESIEIKFPSLDYYVNSLEVRSLFTGEGPTPGAPEQGVVDFYLDGSVVHTENLVAVEPTGGNGVLRIALGTPTLADRLVFRVPTGESYTSFSEFAVARLDVTPIPVPGAVLLAMVGISLAGVKLRKRV